MRVSARPAQVSSGPYVSSKGFAARPGMVRKSDSVRHQCVRRSPGSGSTSGSLTPLPALRSCEREVGTCRQSDASCTAGTQRVRGRGGVLSREAAFANPLGSRRFRCGGGVGPHTIKHDEDGILHAVAATNRIGSLRPSAASRRIAEGILWPAPFSPRSFSTAAWTRRRSSCVRRGRAWSDNLASHDGNGHGVLRASHAGRKV